MTIDVLGFGESSVDFVHIVDGLPRADVSKLRISSHYSTCGGQVATTLAACAALGLRASYLGAVGTDENGARIRQALNERGVDTSRTIARDAETRFALILVDETGGDRVVLWQRDVRLDVDTTQLENDPILDARVVHVDATDEAGSIALAARARSAGAIVTCDVDSVTPHTRELLSHASFPILAEAVPQQLTGVSDVEGALRALRASHPGVLCVTLGERGSAALDGDLFVQVPALAVQPVDTTGAGDVFRAGFIFGLLQEWPTERTLRFANTAAALSCTRHGAMNSVPNLADVERHLR